MSRRIGHSRSRGHGIRYHIQPASEAARRLGQRKGWQGADEASRVVCVEVEAHEVADVGQCGVDGVGEGQVVREVLLPVGVAGEEA